MDSAARESAEESDSELPSHEDLVGVLKESIDEVFSAMFITISQATRTPEDGEIHGEIDEKIDLEVGVDFSGPLCGTVLLRCTDQGAEDIARGLLMMETGDLALEDVMDALGECGNMVTGNLKSKALDPISTFTMGIPRVTADFSGPKTHSSLVYQLASGLMSAELWVDEQPAKT